MLVVDASAFVSLGTAECHDHLIDEFEVHTAETVETELRETSAHDDVHGRSAAAVLERFEDVSVHDVLDEIDRTVPQSSRIDAGEGACVYICRSLEADFFLTDDFRAVPELRQLVNAEVALSALVLRALVDRGVLEEHDARERLETIADTRSWLGAPIYRRALQLFQDG